MTLYRCKSDITGCLTPTPPPNMDGFSLLLQFKFLSLPVKRDDFSNIHPANSIWDPPNKLCSSAFLPGINYKKSATGAGMRSGLLDPEPWEPWCPQTCRICQQGGWNKCLPYKHFPPLLSSLLILCKLPWGNPSYSPQKTESEEPLL